MTKSPVSLNITGPVATICIDNPPVNALSQAVRQGLLDCIGQASTDASIKVIVLICAGRTFIAGADIKEFGKPPLEPSLPDVLETLDQCDTPIIAALHGTALGGGLETALACRYRIADSKAKVGLPEVNLGLIPGAGGTQRLPRIAGLENALDIISSARHVSAKEAENMGLIDLIADGDDLHLAAESFAKRILETKDIRERVSELKIQDSIQNRQILARWKSKISQKARGQQSPLVAMESIENTLSMSFSDGLTRERELFTECLESKQSKALRHIFFAEIEAAKLPATLTGTPAEIGTAAVIGGGTMGRGIAMCFANSNIPVIVIETDQARLNLAMNSIESAYSKMLKQGRINEEQRKLRLSHINGSCDYESLIDTDLVIEAAFEKMSVKQAIFRLLDTHCRPDAILSSNTSYLDIESIASVVRDPSRVVGMHFFSPAHIMKLLEIVRCPMTSADTLSSLMKLGKRLKKRCVLVANGFGFAANRMYAAYQNEGQQMLLEGVKPSQIDRAMKNWGMAMGPIAVLDMSGIDIGHQARKQNPNPPDNPRYFRPADVLAEHGHLGRKTGRGFYRYDENGSAHEDEEILSLVSKEAKRMGVQQRNMEEQDIQKRMIRAISIEGEKILAEEISLRAGDLDVIWVNGYGFPRWRGGPMYLARQ